MMPKVSVIIPTYNCADYLADAIESVQRQSLQEFEIIVVDDGSSDKTIERMRVFLEDARVTLIQQVHRGLPSAARNNGARHARGEYLAFLDADDQLHPDALKAMSEALDEKQANWCVTDIYKIKPTGRELQRTPFPDGNRVHAILRDDFVRRGIFFRTSTFLDVGMYDEHLLGREDWDINIRMFLSATEMCYLPRPLYWYTWREGSITTGKRARMLEDTLKVLQKHHKVLAAAGDREIAAIYAESLWSLARCYLYELRDYRRAAVCALESLRYDFNAARLLHPFLHHWQTRKLRSSQSSAV